MYRFTIRLLPSHLWKILTTSPPSDPLLPKQGTLLLSLFRPPTFSSLTSNGDPPGLWTGDVDYLDEYGGVLFSGKGTRPTEPRSDDHVMVGALKKPILNAVAVAKIVELLRRWKWGPDLDSQLDTLHFSPTMDHIAKAMKVVDEPEASLSLFRWAKRQAWYSPSHHPTITLLSDQLNRHRDYDTLLSLFDELFPHSPSPCSRIIHHLAKAEKMEASFSCFKKMEDFKMETQIYTSLISLFMAKGLAYKAFEVYERMEKVGCGMDLCSYELMVPTLARSGRLDAASKLFLEMKEKGMPPSFNVFASMVDSLGKAGRLDASMKIFMEMCGDGLTPSSAMYVSMVESFLKAGKLESARRLWGEMKEAGLRPNFGIYTMFVESHAKSGMIDVAMAGFREMEKAGFLPTLSTYSCLLDVNASSGDVESSMKLYNSMTMAGLRPGLSTCASLLSLLAKKKLVDVAARVLLEMKNMGGSCVEITASDVLMVFIKEGWVEMGLKWLSFMEASGLRTNNFIIRQLFESCMRRGMYESAKPLLQVFVGSGARVDLVLYTSILAHMVRCRGEEDERRLMEILRGTKHSAHRFLCGMFQGTEERKQAVLSLVREFFNGVDCEGGGVEGGVRYFVNVLLNYLVLMGQMNRARCVWKVAYEKKLFEKAIVFDQHIAWSVDVRNLSVGAAMVAVVHTLHRFRKRMLYYGMVPRRIKVVTGTMLKLVVAQMLEGVESPFEVSKVVLRAPGSSISDWFKKPIVQQFLLNEIPSRADVLMHKLDVLFPTSSPLNRSLSPPKPTPSDFKLKKIYS